MIRNEAEYQEAVKRLVAERERIDGHRARLREMDLADDEIKRVTDPLVSFSLQLAEEVESYERLKRREFAEMHNFNGIGQFLVAARIAMGISQRELASRLGVDESSVSRDERNEYHNIRVDRITRILQALGLHLTTKVESSSSPEKELEYA